MKKVAIIIPTHNRKEYLGKLLAQIKNQREIDFKIYVVVVIDGSVDGTKEMMDNEFFDFKYINGSGNWWFTKCINEGIKYIEPKEPDYILILNDDCEIKPDYLANIYRCKESLQKNCIVGSLIVDINKPNKITFAGVDRINWWTLKSNLNSLQWKELPEKIEVDKIKTLMLCARGSLIPLNILQRLNYLDENNFPQYGSDDELFYKATKNNIDIYISLNAVVYDHYQLSDKNSPKLKPNLGDYISALFNRYSAVYLRKNLILYWRYGYKFLFPYYFLISVIGALKSYIKYR